MATGPERPENYDPMRDTSRPEHTRAGRPYNEAEAEFARQEAYDRDRLADAVERAGRNPVLTNPRDDYNAPGTPRTRRSSRFKGCLIRGGEFLTAGIFFFLAGLCVDYSLRPDVKKATDAAYTKGFNEGKTKGIESVVLEEVAPVKFGDNERLRLSKDKVPKMAAQYKGNVKERVGLFPVYFNRDGQLVEVYVSAERLAELAKSSEKPLGNIREYEKNYDLKNPNPMDKPVKLVEPKPYQPRAKPKTETQPVQPAQPKQEPQPQPLSQSIPPPKPEPVQPQPTQPEPKQELIPEPPQAPQPDQTSDSNIITKPLVPVPDTSDQGWRASKEDLPQCPAVIICPERTWQPVPNSCILNPCVGEMQTGVDCESVYIPLQR